VICERCGQSEVAIGSACSQCGAVAVASDMLDSILSLPAEPVPEALDDGPSSFEPLPVAPASLGLDGHGDDLRWDDIPGRADVDPADDEIDTWGDDAWSTVPAASSASAPASSLDGAEPFEPFDPSRPFDAPEPSDPPALERSPAFEAPAPVSPTPSGPPLPRRTPIDDTRPQWGPRDHPPAVLAPPPPHPLDAPPPRVKRSQGTGLPSAIPGVAPAPTPPPLPPSFSSPAETPVPERPSHPRVRRWFGRGPDEEVAPEPEVVAVPAAVDGPFVGAPEGLLDGVRPEADRGPGVHDPAGFEAAMSRLSSGARRSALAPLNIAAAVLEPGEVAEAVVQGEYQHRPAVVVLTDRRVLVANDRRWSPDVRSFAFDPTLVVHGWQDERRATLVFVLDGVGVEVEAISDRPLARDLAQRVRGRCAGEPPLGS
jgi:hypothetical protein